MTKPATRTIRSRQQRARAITPCIRCFCRKIVAVTCFILAMQILFLNSWHIYHESNGGSFNQGFSINIDRKNPAPDAYFNNYPVFLRPDFGSVHSSVHCVGETHDAQTAWKHRSCNYVHLCLDFSSSSQQQETYSWFFEWQQYCSSNYAAAVATGVLRRCFSI